MPMNPGEKDQFQEYGDAKYQGQYYSDDKLLSHNPAFLSLFRAYGKSPHGCYTYRPQDKNTWRFEPNYNESLNKWAITIITKS